LRDGLWIFVFIFFILAPILERVLKGGANAKRPPGLPPGQRPAPRRPMPGTRFPTEPTAGRPGQTGRPADATDLIPADLWEILTGQRRAEPEPPPQALPAPVAIRPDPGSSRQPSPAGLARGGAAAGPLGEDAAAADLLRRRDREWRVEHAPPAVVSLESEPLPEAGRHAAFHDRVDHLSQPAKVQRGRGPMDLHIASRSELSRAVVLMEVLGRPKGLDD
jgi:hypothetical protein